MAPGGRTTIISTDINRATTVAAPYTLYPPGAATKGVIAQMVRSMAKDLAAKEINVNAVAPGLTGMDLFFAWEERGDD